MSSWTDDSFEMYVEKALMEGLKEITFTEHMPFPGYFIENRKFLDECALSVEAADKYFEAVKNLKPKYENKIKINIWRWKKKKHSEIHGWC